MNNTEFDLFYKELCRMTNRYRRDGKEPMEILQELTDRLVKVSGRSYTTEQVGKILNLVLKEPIRRMGETTFWIHWESGVINCAGKDLDKVKELAVEQQKENGMTFFIT